MKNLAIIFGLLLCLPAFAECFQFVNGNGPTGLGTLNWRPYKAEQVCISNTSTVRGGNYDSVTLLDSEGDIVQMATSLSRGRCGSREICLMGQAVSGNFNGANLTAREVSTLKFQIHMTFQSNIRTYTGTFKDLATGKTFLIMKR